MTLHRTTVRGLLRVLEQIEALEPQQRTLLAVVGNGRGAIVSRDPIMAAFWPGKDGGPLSALRLIDVRVFQLRKAGVPIVTHYGRGLSLGGPHTWGVQPSAARKPQKVRKLRRAA